MRSVRSVGPVLLALAITAYGGVLRLYALSSRYGTVERPAWARVLTRDIAPLARDVEPRIYAWPAVAAPYVGGDPINYLRYAREMRSFYQAHVREPVFLAITRFCLWLLNGQDVAISFASAAASTLIIFATFLLGRAAFSPATGLLAALGWAIDYDAVSWAPEGWRDDTFTLMVVLTTWAIVRLRQRPTPARAVGAGVLGALACLTRITSISWLVPALACVAASPQPELRRRTMPAGIALGCVAILVAPYLINCARATGDPFLAINAHTVYYRAGEGLPYEKPQNGLRYIAGKIRRRPIRETDTALTGVFVLPVTNKWSGFDLWVPHSTRVLEALAVLGLLLFLASWQGRLFLVVVFTSLVPYAFTWNIAGGAEWRFTMHVYPLLLIAAASVIAGAVRAAAAVRHWPQVQLSWRSGPALATAAIILAMGVAAWAYSRLPYAVQREALAHGEEATIAAGSRDSVFFTKGWSAAWQEGAVTARVITGDKARLEFPLPERRAYRLTLRADPARPGIPRGFTVVLNGHVLHRFELQWDPQRVGSYSFDVSPEFAGGDVVLQVIADGVTRAGESGPRYAWLPPQTSISMRVWYLRIHPL